MLQRRMEGRLLSLCWTESSVLEQVPHAFFLRLGGAPWELATAHAIKTMMREAKEQKQQEEREDEEEKWRNGGMDEESRRNKKRNAGRGMQHEECIS